MLELKEIHYHHATSEKPVLHKISLSAQRGAPLIVSGKSGSGKTSLIEVISGLTTQNHGHIYWNKELVNNRQRRSICGVVFQFPERHFIGLTISQELRLGLRRLGQEIEQQIMQKVGLHTLEGKDIPEKLSGGQQ